MADESQDQLLLYDGRFNGFDVWLTLGGFLAFAVNVSNPVIEKMQFNTPWEKITDMDRFWDRYMDKYREQERKSIDEWISA